MNRMTLISVALCAVLVATVGAGVVAAKPDLPRAYRVVQFDVTYEGMVVGKLSINTNAWTYVLNAHGMTPNTLYYFYCLVSSP